VKERASRPLSRGRKRGRDGDRGMRIDINREGAFNSEKEKEKDKVEDSIEIHREPGVIETRSIPE
jgi:hypothetical protein